VTRTTAPAGVDALAAAGMANSAAAKAAPSSRPSLFERVTGIGRSAKPAAKAATAPAAPAAQKAEPQISAPAAAPARQSPAPAAAPQPRLSGLEGQAPATAAGGQEDLLDIPAFLRRQAN
jgi:cell division protein FtsZ